MRQRTKIQHAVLLCAGLSLVVACVASVPSSERQQWSAGLGPVLPHDSFPSDCALCHVGSEWRSLTADFEFDHEEETGVRLYGAHQRAGCLFCHNDRGPVAVFAQRGCVGCHEDIHLGQLGQNCEQCHDELTWRPNQQYEKHNQTRFPLVGVHTVTACRRCHPGSEIGRFVPTDIECVTCHAEDLADAVFPNHLGLGLVDNCDRCHEPYSWNQAKFDGTLLPSTLGDPGVRSLDPQLGRSFKFGSRDAR